jgi:hypothetical protein
LLAPTEDVAAEPEGMPSLLDDDRRARQGPSVGVDDFDGRVGHAVLLDALLGAGQDGVVIGRSSRQRYREQHDNGKC